MNSKKNSCRGNYMRKYGNLVFNEWVEIFDNPLVVDAILNFLTMNNLDCLDIKYKFDAQPIAVH